MSEDHLARDEIAALTRRFESETTVIKGDLLALRLGQAATDQKLESFITEQQRVNARIESLLIQVIANQTGRSVEGEDTK